MTRTPILSNNSSINEASTASINFVAGRLPLRQATSSIYATYWQARSGFFNLTPKLAEARADLGKSNRQ